VAGAAVDLARGRGGEHPRKVADRGNPRAKGFADRFAGGGAAEVVVAAAGARRLGDDLQLAGFGLQLEHGLPGQIAVEPRPLAVGKAGVEVVEREPEPTQVLGPQRGAEVEAFGEFLRALDDAREAADQDIGDALALERGQERVGVERLRPPAHEARPALPWTCRNRWTRRSGERSAFFCVPAFSPHDLRRRRVSLLHLVGMPWARIGELVGHDDLVTTARTYTHVVVDERELDYDALLG
jgi:hypothetical protein